MINTLVRAADFLYFHSPAAFVTQQRDTLVVRGERGNELADALFDLLFTAAFLPGVKIRLVRLLPEGADEAERVFVSRNEEGIAPFVLQQSAEVKDGQQLTACFAEDGDFSREYKLELQSIVESAAAQARQGMGEAVEVLRGIANDSEAPVNARVSAARVLVENGPKIIEVQDFEARINRLEARESEY